MRQSLSVLLTAAYLVAVASVAPALAIRINSPAPNFTLKDLQGQQQSLSSYRGKVVILNFWSSTCGPCVEEIPSLNDLYRQLKSEGLVVLGVALDPAAKPVSDLVAKFKVDSPNVMDSDQQVYLDRYALFGQPVSVIIDRRGIVRDKMIGAVEWTSPMVKAKVQAYLMLR